MSGKYPDRGSGRLSAGICGSGAGGSGRTSGTPHGSESRAARAAEVGHTETPRSARTRLGFIPNDGEAHPSIIPGGVCLERDSRATSRESATWGVTTLPRRRAWRRERAAACPETREEPGKGNRRRGSAKELGTGKGPITFTFPLARGQVFVVGYGLDYAERYRNLPDVRILSLPEGSQ
jgi:hypothetical protein